MRFVPILAAVLTLAAAPVAAQSWGGTWEHEQGRRDGGWNSVPSTFDWRSQLDRPGDYRCDRFWDASRTDCDARWRDRRQEVSYGARRDYRALGGRDGYRDRHDRYGDRYGYGRAAYGRGYGYSPRRYGYASGYGYGQDGSAYYGAYGRPDLVYPEGGGYGRGHTGARDPRRSDWCRANYRSYDPSSGYYRAYSGRLIFCG